MERSSEILSDLKNKLIFDKKLWRNIWSYKKKTELKNIQKKTKYINKKIYKICDIFHCDRVQSFKFIYNDFTPTFLYAYIKCSFFKNLIFL